MRMLQVKEGDYIIVPRLPRWDDVCILVATEDGILDINLKFLEEISPQSQESLLEMK